MSCSAPLVQQSIKAERLRVHGVRLQLKPMNCPFHISVYKQGFYSYRDLPIRWAELGTGMRRKVAALAI